MQERPNTRKPIVLAPDQGRVYPMGRIRAVFKADCDETANGYSVSEWWMEPRTAGPSMHDHPDDHVFYIVAGTVSLCVAGAWHHLTRGSYVIVPGGTPHSFENRGAEAAGFISFNVPGGFEAKTANIASALAAEDLQLDP